MDFKTILQSVVESKSPDLHLQVGKLPMIRLKNGSLQALEANAPLTAEEMGAVIDQITTGDQKREFEEKGETDFSYEMPGLSRFRVNIFKEREGSAIAFRTISESIPSLQELGLPEGVVENLSNLSHGLVLVTGVTGMGKSTTLASIIDHINANRAAHILTIEDPIEFVYQQKKALITQREVTRHTHSFAEAIRSALRQDPDVVMVGEMRDLETIAAAITLAETGHLVFSTLHTADAAQTIDRIIDVFPPYQQQQIRTQLASALKAVIAQVLVPRADGQGRVAAREIMLTNDAIQNCINKGETHQIYSMMQLGGAQGMQLLDQNLAALAKQGIITPQEALAKGNDLESLQGQLAPQDNTI